MVHSDSLDTQVKDTYKMRCNDLYKDALTLHYQNKLP